MLKEKAIATNGYVAPRKGCLTFGWWNLPGLYALENGGALCIQFWPFGPVGKEQLRPASKELFLKHFRDEPPHEHGAYLDLPPIMRDTDRDKAEDLVLRLEVLYQELQALRRKHGANTPTPQDPKAEDELAD
jgi:hypothetical protein